MKQLHFVRESGEPIQQYAGEAFRGVELDEVARFRDDAEFGAGDSAREHVRPGERNPGVPFTPHYENRKCELVVAVLDVAGVTLVGLLYLSIERGLTVVAEPGADERVVVEVANRAVRGAGDVLTDQCLV